MNCNDFKELISELADLKEVGKDAAAHMHGCDRCQKQFKYEESLRGGFAAINETPLPAELTRKILTIPGTAGYETRKMPVWLQKFQALLNSFTFRLAVASGVTGFLFAVVLLRGPAYDQVAPTAPGNPNITLHSPARALKSPAVTVAPESAKDKPALAAAGSAVMPVTEPQGRGPVLKGFPEQFEALVKNLPAAPEPKNEVVNRIPGAISFSLDGEKEAKRQFSETDDRQFAEPPAEVSEASPADASAEYAADVMVAAAPVEHEELSAKKLSELEPDTKADSLVTKLRAAVQPAADQPGLQAADPRGTQILAFLEKNGIDNLEGFIDLERLAMQGFLTNRQFLEWRPPAGQNWFLTRSEGKASLTLRRNP